MKKFTTRRQKIGEKGEDIAVMFLVKQGFEILERNYTKKCGEIDIVAYKNNTLHFFEVKTLKQHNKSYVSHETYRPEDNMNFRKFNKIIKTIEIYLLENMVSRETYWEINFISVVLNEFDEIKNIEIINNITY